MGGAVTPGSKALAIFLAALALAPVARAASPETKTSQSATARVEARDFEAGRGSFRSAEVEFKFDDGNTTVLAAPVFGERRSQGSSRSAFGGGVTVYQELSHRLSTRTHLFLSEGNGVYARVDAAQDVTARLARQLTMTAGARWAEYDGGRSTTFLSVGGRRYFEGGSAAYRLTWTRPEGQDGFLAHLVNLTLNDKRGRGKTQLWASAGAASVSQAQFDSGFSGADYGILAQRTQPLTDTFALIAAAGYSSYDDPSGRYGAVNLGLGLSVDLEPAPLFGN